MTSWEEQVRSHAFANRKSHREVIRNPIARKQERGRASLKRVIRSRSPELEKMEESYEGKEGGRAPDSSFRFDE